jgi:hypothetical protein
MAENDYCGSVGVMAVIHDTLREHIWNTEIPECIPPYIWCLCGWRSDDLPCDQGTEMAALLVHLSNAIQAATVEPIRDWIERHPAPVPHPAATDPSDGGA